MKSLTVRLPEDLVAAIESESRGRKISKSDVVRERLRLVAPPARRGGSVPDEIADLVGAVDGLAPDVSTRKRHYLKAALDARKRRR